MTDTLARKPVSLVPFADRMIVRVIKHGDKTKGGLWVPELANDNKSFITAEVLFVGPGRIAAGSGANVPVQFTPGAIVVFFRGGSLREQQLVLPDEEDLMLISESHVAYELKGLEHVSGLIADDGRPLVMSS